MPGHDVETGVGACGRDGIHMSWHERTDYTEATRVAITCDIVGPWCITWRRRTTGTHMGHGCAREGNRLQSSPWLGRQLHIDSASRVSAMTRRTRRSSYRGTFHGLPCCTSGSRSACDRGSVVGAVITLSLDEYGTTCRLGASCFRTRFSGDEQPADTLPTSVNASGTCHSPDRTRTPQPTRTARQERTDA
jgi:hypothetical protein